LVGKGPSPIAALAINMAVTPGGFAVLVGSGFSRSSGAPSAWEVLRDITARWYAAETGSPAPSSLDPIAWARKHLGCEPTYSLVLERLFPERAQRQELLSGYFVGREPTPAHRILARMAADGLVRVIVTTNFDRLIEAALDELAIRWSRVTTEAELQTSQPRDVAPVFILKLHGDYGSIDIRNTTDEIAVLSPGIGDELGAILRLHGLLLVGYAGSDPAVAEILRTIRPRLGLYWTVLGVTTPLQAELLANVDGYAIQIEDADHFMADLVRRTDTLRQSPSSSLPLDVYRETVSLIRAGDLVGIREEIKRHVSAAVDWYEGWRETISKANLDWTSSPSWGLEQWRPRIARFAEELGPAVEDLLGVGLALAEYRSEDLPVFLHWVDRLHATQYPPSGRYAPQIAGSGGDLASACVLQLMAGALALRVWSALEILMTWPDESGRSSTLGLSATFNNYEFFDTYFWQLPHVHRLLLSQSEVWKEAVRERSDGIVYVIWAGVLLSTQAEARGESSQAIAAWSFVWDHHAQRLEDLARMIGRDDELANVLGRMVGETGAEYRQHFADRYGAALARLRGIVYVGRPYALQESQIQRALGLEEGQGAS